MTRFLRELSAKLDSVQFNESADNPWSKLGKALDAPYNQAQQRKAKSIKALKSGGLLLAGSGLTLGAIGIHRALKNRKKISSRPSVR